MSAWFPIGLVRVPIYYKLAAPPGHKIGPQIAHGGARRLHAGLLHTAHFG
jgi:hypothetical protein